MAGLNPAGAMDNDERFAAALARHDALVAACGLGLWVGSEPTFTDPQAQTPAWLFDALGDDKQPRARALVRTLYQHLPAGALVLRSQGRRYAGESVPRWNYGLLCNRDARPLWRGPLDPMLLAGDGAGTCRSPAQQPCPGDWAQTLAQVLREQAWEVDGPCAPQDGCWRLTVRTACGQTLSLGVHELEAPTDAATDAPTDGPVGLALAWPPMDDVALFRRLLAGVEAAALRSGLCALVWAGAAPPVDDSLALTTITPDPAVIEVNAAPSDSALAFYQRSRTIYAAAQTQGLAPYRLYFTGQVADSGGAGQITLGGPSPQSSPFVQNTRLLPRLLRFFNRHPALSYLFSHDHVGGSGQSVRADERGLDAFDELKLTLALLRRHEPVSPERLNLSLAPFLCDPVGNSHRAEINIEKLWNPALADRGCLGLVEFRALRMQHTPQRATALACLLRAIVASLHRHDLAPDLVDWGRELHDRMALPFYLEQDLREVLDALDAADQGLDEAITQELLRDEFRLLGCWPIADGVLELRRALEFWPLLGDAASAAQSGASRRVDASTTRLEMRWRPADPLALGLQNPWQGWEWHAGPHRLPLRTERDAQGELQVLGLRYRSFAPSVGLHPMLGAQAPLTLTLAHRQAGQSYCVQWHEWQPQGGAYAGVPSDLADAAARRSARLTVRPHTPGDPLPNTLDLHAGPGMPPASARAVTPGRPSAPSDPPYSLDLRDLLPRRP